VAVVNTAYNINNTRLRERKDIMHGKVLLTYLFTDKEKSNAVAIMQILGNANQCVAYFIQLLLFISTWWS